MLDNGQLTLNNFSGNSALILCTTFHAEFAQVLLETVLNLIYRCDSDVVSEYRFSHTKLYYFIWNKSSGQGSSFKSWNFVVRTH